MKIQCIEDTEKHDDSEEIVEPPEQKADSIQNNVNVMDPISLLKDQYRAYDIIDWHLNETLSDHHPPQLMMIIPGEGGVSKSKTIQIITENFKQRGIVHLLVKSTYIGIAASLIDGKTLHMAVQIPFNGRNHSWKANEKLARFWQKRLYFIINKKLMLFCKFFTQISSALSKAKSLARVVESDLPFGGVNVVLVGNFHQFPLVVGHPLYWLLDVMTANAKELLGRSLYEQFKMVVCLKEQVQVIDTDWLDLLQHVCNGNCWSHHINMLHSLIITNPNCLSTDFSQSPWNCAVLITPRHSVCRHWNISMSRKHCQQTNQQLFMCPAMNSIQGQPLTLAKCFSLASKMHRCNGKQGEHGGLADSVMLSIGMNVMVIFNIETNLDVANGAQGKIVKIVMNNCEPEFSL